MQSRGFMTHTNRAPSHTRALHSNTDQMELVFTSFFILLTLGRHIESKAVVYNDARVSNVREIPDKKKKSIKSESFSNKTQSSS